MKGKKTISLLLSLVMVFSAISAGVVSASAADATAVAEAVTDDNTSDKKAESGTDNSVSKLLFAPFSVLGPVASQAAPQEKEYNPFLVVLMKIWNIFFGWIYEFPIPERPVPDPPVVVGEEVFFLNVGGAYAAYDGNHYIVEPGREFRIVAASNVIDSQDIRLNYDADAYGDKVIAFEGEDAIIAFDGYDATFDAGYNGKVFEFLALNKDEISFSVLYKDLKGNDVSKEFVVEIKEGDSVCFGYKDIGHSELMVTDCYGFDDTQTVNIPNTVRNYKVTKIGERVFQDNKTIEEVKLPKECNEIKERAFENCSKLRTVNGIDSVRTFGDYAFSGCSVLGNVKFSKDVAYIGRFAFKDCRALGSITIPQNIKGIGSGAFSYGTVKPRNDYEIIMPESIMGAWDACTQQSSYSDAVYNSMTDSFRTTIFYRVVDDGYKIIRVFTEGGSVDIPGYILGKQVVSIGSPDNDKCVVETNGSDYTIDDIALYDGILAIEAHAFQGIPNMTGVWMPSTVKSIGDYAFYNCLNLQVVGMELEAELETIGDYAFYNCPIELIEIPMNVTSIGNNAFGYYEYWLIPGGNQNNTNPVPENVTAILPDRFIDYNEDGSVAVFGAKSYCSSRFQTFYYTTYKNNVNRTVCAITSMASKNYPLVIPQTVCHALIEFIGDPTGAPKRVLNPDVHSLPRIPNSIKGIGAYAFAVEDNGDQSRIVVPESVVDIGENAFLNVDKVYFFSNISEGEPWGAKEIIRTE